MARFAPFERRPKIAVAVSGGSDSVCLAVMAAGWVRRQHGEIRAFVVDHGLRREAEAEAAEVAMSMTRLGMAVEVLHWQHPPLVSAIQRQAREARYALLDAAVARWGALHLLVAHHADDQAETVAMRAAMGSGSVGLSGMPAVAERAQLRVLRPLLDVPKARLVATLRSLAIDWIEDQSNADERFCRARLRAAGQAIQPVKCDPSARHRLDAGAAAFLGRNGRLSPARRVRFEREAFRALEPSLARHVLGRTLAALADRYYMPAAAALFRLQRAIVEPGPGAKSLGGCTIRFGERWVRLRTEEEPGSPWRPPVAAAPVPFGTPPSEGCDLASRDK